MEFLRICQNEKYFDVILSMKASNTRIMVQAYRLLVAQMIKEQMNFPLHLGVRSWRGRRWKNKISSWYWSFIS